MIGARSRFRLLKQPLLGSVGFRQFELTKDLGDGIDFLVPCTNSGNAAGTAFIKVREPSTGFVWASPAFNIPILQTVNVNMHQTVDLSLGLHHMIPELHEGFPPDGTKLINSATFDLTVVSSPILSAVGPPIINGIVGATNIILPRNSAIPISWLCQNNGGGSGRARLRFVSSIQPAYNQISDFVIIPGFTAINILFTLGAVGLASIPINVVLTMEDDLASPTILGTWQFTIQTT